MTTVEHYSPQGFVDRGNVGRAGVELENDLQADGLPADEITLQVVRSRQRIEGAPLGILLCLDSASLNSYPDSHRRQAEWLMGVQGVAMAAENLLLAAHAEGLGGIWLCAPLFAPLAACQALGLPETWQPQGLLLLGYPARVPPARMRRSLMEATRFF